MSETLQLSVPGMHCGHCERAVKDEVSTVPGVSDVVVDLGTKVVTVTGSPLDEAAVRAAVAEAGYEAA
jgi:copper chaperone